MAKNQRDSERLTPRDVDKIHQLYRTHLIEISLIAERFGLEEDAVSYVLSKPHTPRDKRWRVRWDDEQGERQDRCFESFRASRMFAARIKSDYVRVEPA